MASVNNNTAGDLTANTSQTNMPRAHPNGPTNAEAGPSNSTGGSPETTVDAKVAEDVAEGVAKSVAESVTEEDAEGDVVEEDVVEDVARPLTRGKTRPWRDRHRNATKRLCKWAKEWKGLNRVPSQRDSLRIALEVVESLRPTPVYPLHRLKNGARGATGRQVMGGAADNEAGRREGIREAYEELSRYYKLPEGQVEWGCPDLLLQVLREVEPLQKPRGMTFA